MRVIIYTDNTLPVSTHALCKLLNETCQTVRFTAGEKQIHLQTSTVSCPGTYKAIPQDVHEECKKYDLALIGTSIAYDNNWFFEGYKNEVIISFAGWQHLTDLPVSNGFVYFITAILTEEIELGEEHDVNTGCINDVWWDKKGVNFGMRAAFICNNCLSSFKPKDKTKNKIVTDITALLNLLSTVSRSGKEILSFKPEQSAPTKKHFDIFLCHNTDDKPAIREIRDKMKAEGISPWFDEDHLKLGIPWQPELENEIESIKAAAVFVGSSGLGPWQSAEIRAFLSEFADRQCPVIPVILPDAHEVPKLPLFLRQMTWVDLRKDYTTGLNRLIAAVKQ